MAREGAAAEVLGPALEPEKFIEAHRRLANAEASAASDAGERRQQIGALFEGMRLENKAASQARAILKIKNEGKRRDAVRTWQQLLPMLEDAILGGVQDEMDLHPKNGTDDEAAVDPVDFEGDYDPTTMEPGPHNDDEDSEDFAAAVDEAYGDNVEPIDFDETRAAE